MRTFGKNLERLELIKGRFETDVCRHNKIPRSTYRQWKEGSQEIFLQRLVQLADYFGVTVDELVRVHTHIPLNQLQQTDLKLIIRTIMRDLAQESSVYKHRNDIY